MLIEHRAYTLMLGAGDAYWDAQQLRGSDGLRPILERALGSFAACSGAADQIVSLYRWDGFDDGQSRLRQVYGSADLRAYFRAVRPLIVRQASRFMVPAPLPALTPLWGNGRDWLPPDGPRVARPAMVEETAWTLRAGGLPACWEAIRACGLEDEPDLLEPLLGVFASVAGPLNQVTWYRRFSDMAACQAHREALRASARWREFQADLAPLLVDSEIKFLSPSRLADMAPLFDPPGTAASAE